MPMHFLTGFIYLNNKTDFGIANYVIKEKSMYLAKSLWGQNKGKNGDQAAVQANCCVTVGW